MPHPRSRSRSSLALSPTLFPTAAAPVFALALSTGSASAAWQAVQDFNALAPGGLDGQAGWIAGDPANANVVADPDDATNQVAAIAESGANVYAPLGVTLADGTTSTVFFRARTPEGSDFVLGSSDVAAPGAWDDYEGYMRFAAGNIDVRDGGGFTPALAGFAVDTWYNIWLVLDHTTDMTTLYYSTGSDPATMGATGAFRETAGNPSHDDIINFLVRTGNDHAGLTGLVDDIYVDPDGENLTNPAGDGGGGSDGLFDPTKTRAAYPVTEAPVIDGFIDAFEWELAEGAGGWWVIEPNLDVADELKGGSVGNGTVPFDSLDLMVTMFASFDDENLYIGVRVADDLLFNDDAEAGSANGMTWLDDSVEVFIDGDNSNFPDVDTTGTNPAVVDTGGQFVISANNAYREAEAGNPGFGETAAWYAVAELNDPDPFFATGYDAEFRISLDAIGNPQPGDVIGLTIAVNDDDDGGPNERQVIWSGQAHRESSYGNLLFGMKTHEALLVETAPVIDGVATAEEYGNGEAMVVVPAEGMYDVGAGDDEFTPEDHSFTAWVAHDADAIYVAVAVADDMVVTDSTSTGEEDGQTWQDDGVEIFFDAEETNIAGLYHQNIPPDALFDGQYVFTPNGAWRDNEAANPIFGEAGDWFAASQMTADGYLIEFKVNKSALPIPDGPNTPIGFNICINDDDGLTGNREAQMNWSGRPHNEYTYGFLILSDTTGGGGGGGPALEFTDISVATDDITGQVTVTITWNSQDGKNYKIESSPTLAAPWTEESDGWASQGTSTSFVDSDVAAGTTEIFYRVTEL